MCWMLLLVRTLFRNLIYIPSRDIYQCRLLIKSTSLTYVNDALMDEKRKDQLRSLVSRTVVSLAPSGAMIIAD